MLLMRRLCALGRTLSPSFRALSTAPLSFNLARKNIGLLGRTGTREGEKGRSCFSIPRRHLAGLSPPTVSSPLLSSPFLALFLSFDGPHKTLSHLCTCKQGPLRRSVWSSVMSPNCCQIKRPSLKTSPCPFTLGLTLSLVLCFPRLALTYCSAKIGVLGINGDHQSSIINHQSSIINHQSSIINHQSNVFQIKRKERDDNTMTTLQDPESRV